MNNPLKEGFIRPVCRFIAAKFKKIIRREKEPEYAEITDLIPVLAPPKDVTRIKNPIYEDGGLNRVYSETIDKNGNIVKNDLTRSDTEPIYLDADAVPDEFVPKTQGGVDNPSYFRNDFTTQTTGGVDNPLYYEGIYIRYGFNCNNKAQN